VRALLVDDLCVQRGRPGGHGDHRADGQRRGDLTERHMGEVVELQRTADVRPVGEVVAEERGVERDGDVHRRGPLRDERREELPQRLLVVRVGVPGPEGHRGGQQRRVLVRTPAGGLDLTGGHGAAATGAAALAAAVAARSAARRKSPTPHRSPPSSEMTSPSCVRSCLRPR